MDGAHRQRAQSQLRLQLPEMKISETGTVLQLFRPSQRQMHLLVAGSLGMMICFLMSGSRSYWPVFDVKPLGYDIACDDRLYYLNSNIWLLQHNFVFGDPLMTTVLACSTSILARDISHANHDILL
jgi:hypothetical protein